MAESRPLGRITWQTESGFAEYVIKPDEVVVAGRSSENAIVIEDLMLSRRHAQFTWDNEAFAYAVQDLGSANGTYVNGQRIAKPHRLVDGDEIRLDQRTLKFHLIQPVIEHETIVAPTVQAEPTDVARLVIRAGPDAGQEIQITGDGLTVGRAGRNATWEVRLTDRTVSRPHFRIQRQGPGFVIEDLGSANGTQVNEQVINAPRPLSDGDVIAVGETRLVFRAGQGS